MSLEALPHAIEALLERVPAAAEACLRTLCVRRTETVAGIAWSTEQAPGPSDERPGAHLTLLRTPTTFPSTTTSVLMIGSMESFSS